MTPAKDLLLRTDGEHKADALAHFVEGLSLEEGGEMGKALAAYRKVKPNISASDMLQRKKWMQVAFAKTIFIATAEHQCDKVLIAQTSCVEEIKPRTRAVLGRAAGAKDILHEHGHAIGDRHIKVHLLSSAIDGDFRNGSDRRLRDSRDQILTVGD